MGTEIEVSFYFARSFINILLHRLCSTQHNSHVSPIHRSYFTQKEISPSAFINAFLISSNKVLATIGGTALPICFLTPLSENICSSGKPWMPANSRWVRARRPLGWIMPAPEVVMQRASRLLSCAGPLCVRAALTSWLGQFDGMLDIASFMVVQGLRPVSSGLAEWVGGGNEGRGSPGLFWLVGRYEVS